MSMSDEGKASPVTQLPKIRTTAVGQRERTMDRNSRNTAIRTSLCTSIRPDMI